MIADAEYPALSEVPTDAPNPMLETLDPGAGEAAFQSLPFEVGADRLPLHDLGQIRISEQKKLEEFQRLDEAVLDWNGFSKGKNIPLGYNPTPDKINRRLAGSFMRLAHGQPFKNQTEQDVFRDRYAKEFFDGKGAGDDLAFFGEVKKQAQGRKDTAERMTDLRTQAITSATAGIVTHEEAAKPFAAWIAESKGKPGFDPTRSADYLEEWNAVRSRVKDELAPLGQAFPDAVAAIQAGDLDLEKFYTEVPPDQQEDFLAALKVVIQAQPEEEQATIWGNILKGNERLGRDVGDSLTHFGSKQLRMLPPDPNGPDALLGPEFVAQQQKDYESYLAHEAEIARKRNFRDDINRVRDEGYDPIKRLYPQGGVKGFLEGSAYTLQSAVGSMAVAAVPGAGQVAMLAFTEDYVHRDMRRALLDGGMSRERAEEVSGQLAPFVALPSAGLEMLQVGALAKKVPFFEKFLHSTADRFSNAAMRWGTRAAATGAGETLIENTQDILPQLAQQAASALSQDVPEVKWDKFFDGYGARTAETFAGMMVLGFASGYGGRQRDLRVAANEKMSDTQLEAFYGSKEAVANIRAAQAKGLATADAVIEQELARRNPNSEEAKAAVEKLKVEAQEQKAALAEAQQSGIMPTFSRGTDGTWTVYDGQTQEEIGKAATTSDAIRLGAAHSAAIDEGNADLVAYLGSTMMGIEGLSDGKTETAFAPGKKVTETQQAAISDGDFESIRAQAETRDALTGTPGIAGIVLGRSSTEFKQGVRRTVNELNAGAALPTVFHETTHGHFEEALATGRLTKAETEEFLRAANTIFAGKTTKDGRPIQFLPDGPVTDTALREGVSEFAEMEVFRTRSGGVAGADKPAIAGLPSGLISRNVAAFARLAPGAAKKFTRFFEAIRSFWGVALKRAAVMDKAIREGKMDEAKLDAFKEKLYGLKQQDDHDAAAAKVASEITGQPAASFSLGIDPEGGDKEGDGRTANPGTRKPPQSQGSGGQADSRAIASEVARAAAAAGSAEYIGAGRESVVIALGENRVLKAIRPDGIMVHDADGSLARSTDPADLADKVQAINALGGMPTEAYESDGFLYITQDRGTPISQAEYESARLPFNIRPADGGTFGITIDGQYFIISDLNRNNFVKDAQGKVRVADLVTGRVDEGVSSLADVNESSLSLGPAEMADVVARQALKNTGAPKAKAAIFKNIADRMGKLEVLVNKTGNAYNFDAFGKPYEGEAKFSQEKKDILNGLALLDGILAAMPPDLRGRVGGYTQLAKLDTNEKRLDYLKRRLKTADRVVNDYLKREYGKMMERLLEKAKPAKDEAGKKKVGKAGADVHSLFDTLRGVMTMDDVGVQRHIAGIDAELNDTNNPPTPEREAHLILERGLTEQMGDWKNADAARRAAAVENAQNVWDAAYATFKLAKLMEKEDRQIFRGAMQKATGKQGTKAERDTKIAKDNKLSGKWKDSLLSLSSFEQVLHYVFGDKSAEAQKLADMEREASNQKEDTVQAKMDALDQLFTSLAGGELEGQQLRWDMAQKSIKVNGIEFSQNEAIGVTLMWRQEDGRRHMIGRLDENAKPAGPWHYDQAFVDQVEAALSPEALALRSRLMAEYSGEYAVLNPVYRALNGINLPQNENYSPISVAPQQAPAGQVASPITGQAVGASVTPGSLRTRGSAIAEPKFPDALQTFIAHTKEIQHFIAYAPFSMEAQAILGNRELANAVQAKGGEQAVTVLRQWLDLFAQGGVRDAAAQLALNGFMNRLTSRAAGMALIGRMGVLAIQSTQLGAALAEMPTGAYVKRLGMLMTGQLGWGAARKSEFVQRRIQQMPPVVQQAMQGLLASEPNRVKSWVQKMGTWISGADGLFTAGTFAMVHDYQLTQAKSMGMTGPEADAFALAAAERVTERVAQPTRMGTRSIFENNLSSPLARTSWAFASEARQKLILSAWALGSKPLGAKLRALAVTWIVGGMVSTLIRSVWRDMKDDDDETFDEKNWGVKRMILSSLTGPIGGIPLLGDAAEAGIYKAAGEYIPEGNLISGLGASFKAATRISDWGDSKPDEIVRDVDNLLSGIGLFNDTIAAAASLAHLARDLFNVVENATED